MTYEEGRELRWKWVQGALAEYHGYCDAQFTDKDMHIKYTEEYLIGRHAGGLSDGLAIKMQSEVQV